jgi:hypothetical protein
MKIVRSRYHTWMDRLVTAVDSVNFIAVLPEFC